MIEAIAVMLQDEIAAHSFDQPTGSGYWPARRCSIGRLRAGRPIALSAPGIMAACATPRSDLVLYANGWSDVGMRP